MSWYCFLLFSLCLCICENAVLVEGLSESPAFHQSVPAQVAVGLAVPIIILFGVYSIFMVYRKREQPKTTEEFITARGTQNMWKIAFSLYASAVGAGVISGPASFAIQCGLIGAFMYAFATGIPVIMVAVFGDKIREWYPRVLSLSDYAKLRFGVCTQIFVVVLTLFNMSVAAIAELSTIASMFGDYAGLGSYDVFIILLITLTTLTYTGFGGLKTSIITDRVQAVFGLLLILTFAIYIMATFRLTDADKANWDNYKGTNVSGYSTIFTMPLSLCTATIFSEAMWQRVWASESKKSLRIGSVIGCIMIFSVALLFGIVGILVAMAGRNEKDLNENLYAFMIINDEYYGNYGDGTPIYGPIVQSAMGVTLMILAVVLNESAVDSLQNGIAASLSGAISPYSKKLGSVLASRTILIILNVPLIVVAIQKLSVISLFLVTNMITVMGSFPIALGLYKGFFFAKYISDLVPFPSFVISFLCTVIYGCSDVWVESLSFGENLKNGIEMTFYYNYYAWDYFLVAFCTSIGATFVMITINFLLIQILPNYFQEKDLEYQGKEDTEDAYDYSLSNKDEEFQTFEAAKQNEQKKSAMSLSVK